MIKSGVKTSELWLSVLAIVVSYLMTRGAIDEVEGNLILELAPLLVPVILAGVYTWSRTRVKTAAIEAEKADPAIELESVGSVEIKVDNND